MLLEVRKKDLKRICGFSFWQGDRVARMKGGQRKNGRGGVMKETARAVQS